MARIKSALELAMERIEDIESDPEQIRKDRLTQQGKRLAGSFLFSHDKTIEETQADLKAVPDADVDLVRQAMTDTALANLSLPQDENYVDGLGKIKALLTLLSSGGEDLMGLFVQTDNLYNQYLTMKEQTYDQLVEQFKPRLEQKRKMIQQQTGQNIEIQPEMDKDFMQMANQTFKRMDDQFTQVLGQLKDAIRETL